MKTWEDVGIEVPSGRSDGEIQATCPRCSSGRKNKKAKCLSANLDKLVWVCHHCGWAGSLETGKQEHHPPAWRKPRWRRPEPAVDARLGKNAADWLADRGITAETAKAAGLYAAKTYMPQIEGHSAAIVFPYMRDGELLNRKYRTREKHFRMDTGAERLLYRVDSIEDEVLVWVEGEMDALSVAQAGVASCVSVPDGAPSPESKDYSSKFEFLDSVEERLATVKKHVIAVDSDEAGKRLEDELARRLGREKCWRVEWPTGCKDANEVLVNHGATELRWFIDNAKQFPIEGVFSALGESTKIYDLYRNGFEGGRSTGWVSLDKHYTVRPGEFTVVVGTPGSGKSNWLDALMVNLATIHGWGFAIFSPENQPIEDHMARVVEKYVGMPFGDGPTQRMGEDELKVGMKWAEEHFRWMLPNDEKNWRIEWILDRAKELVYRNGIRGLVIDPWNELEASRNEGETETEYVSRVLRTVRQWARRHGVHVWVAVHPTKMHRDKDGRYPVPTLYDASGSANWRNKADNGVCIWRDMDPESGRALEVDIHVQKIRFRQVGKLGRVTLDYDLATGRYSDQWKRPEVAQEVRYGN